MPKPPTPQGYISIAVQASPGIQVDLLSCKKCGAIVLMYRTHNDYHKKNG